MWKMFAYNILLNKEVEIAGKFIFGVISAEKPGLLLSIAK